MPRRLILVPTEGERRVIQQAIDAAGGSHRIELCGFGAVAAAARTAALIAALEPSSVILVGIAGSLDDRLVLGAARRFGRVACYGIGAGTGADFVRAETMGWPQWPGDLTGGQSAIGDQIAGNAAADDGLLLSVCAASADPADVALRRRMFPAAVAEDMEGFGVALACALKQVPWQVIRGISNRAGDRDRSRWAVEPALRAAAELTVTALAEAP